MFQEAINKNVMLIKTIICYIILKIATVFYSYYSWLSKVRFREMLPKVPTNTTSYLLKIAKAFYYSYKVKFMFQEGINKNVMSLLCVIYWR